MHFRSTADLAALIATGLQRLPPDIDLVVGIPRSGLLAAAMLALDLNIPLTDVKGFAEGRLFSASANRASSGWVKTVDDARHILVIDDSVNSGNAIGRARDLMRARRVPGKLTFAAAYASPAGRKHVDFYFELCPMPRMFGWNYLHHDNLSRCCVDIDGVLCVDPDEHQNDDGARYLKFLLEARALRVPSKEIGWLVTSRLGKYRSETESWLSEQGIKYRRLIMLENTSAADRRRLRLHAEFKANIFKNVDAELFIESDPEQAPEIAHRSGKPVLCVATQRLADPGLTFARAKHTMRSLGVRFSRGAISRLKR